MVRVKDIKACQNCRQAVYRYGRRWVHVQDYAGRLTCRVNNIAEPLRSKGTRRNGLYPYGPKHKAKPITRRKA